MTQRGGTLDDGTPVPGRPVPVGAHLLELRGGAGALSGIRHGAPSNGEPWVLLVPGFLGSKEDFLPLLDPLARRGHGTVAYSQRGQYLSDGPGDFGAVRNRDGYRIADFADDLLAVASQVDGGRPVHLVGHSFGGLIAAEAITRAPGAFASYVHWNSGPRSRFAHGYAVDIVAQSGSAALEPFAALEHAGEIADWARERIRATRSGYLLGAAMLLLEQEDDTPRLAASGLRMLVAHGEHDDRWPLEWQRDLAARVGADYAVVPDAGHGAQIDAPEASADLLHAFWAGLPLPGSRNPRDSR